VPTIFRVMTPEGDKPAVGRSGRMLGIRLPDETRPEGVVDIVPDSDGEVRPGGRGLSVSPGFQHLPIERLPKRFRKLRPGARGRDSDRVWRHGTGPFAPGPVARGLALQPDRPDHGVVEPAEVMKVEMYEHALAATVADWVIDEP
jgi:hypothetical protein